MAAYLNRVQLIGYLGADPETNATGKGDPVANFRIATTQVVKNKETNAKTEYTEWHRIAVFNGLATIAAEYLKKGSQVYVEGRLRTRKWQDKEGNDQYTTEIVADDIQMLGKKPADA